MPFSIVSVAEDSFQRPFKTLAHAYSSPTDSVVIPNQKYLFLERGECGGP